MRRRGWRARRAAEPGDAGAAVAPDEPVGAEVDLRNLVVELLVRDDPTVAGGEERVVGVGERLARRRSPGRGNCQTMRLRRRDDQELVRVAVGDQHVARHRAGRDRRQAECSSAGLAGARRTRSGRDCTVVRVATGTATLRIAAAAAALAVVASEVVQPRPGKRESHRGERDAGDQRRADRACPKSSAAGRTSRVAPRPRQPAQRRRARGSRRRPTQTTKLALCRPTIIPCAGRTRSSRRRCRARRSWRATSTGATRNRMSGWGGPFATYSRRRLVVAHEPIAGRAELEGTGGIRSMPTNTCTERSGRKEEDRDRPRQRESARGRRPSRPVRALVALDAAESSPHPHADQRTVPEMSEDEREFIPRSSPPA